jgi:hypothetical protein
VPGVLWGCDHGAAVLACQRARRGQLHVGGITAMLEVQLARPGRDGMARAHAVSVTACAAERGCAWRRRRGHVHLRVSTG